MSAQNMLKGETMTKMFMRADAKNPLDSSVIDEAKALLKEAELMLQETGSELYFFLQSILTVLLSRQLPTFAVAATKDGTILFINPDFVKKLGNKQNVMFVLVHELYHVLLGDTTEEKTASNALDSYLVTLCQEAYINNIVKEQFSLGTPLDTDGKEVGISPDKVYSEYVEAATKASKEPVSRGVFFSSKKDMFDELKRVNMLRIKSDDNFHD